MLFDHESMTKVDIVSKTLSRKHSVLCELCSICSGLTEWQVARYCKASDFYASKDVSFVEVWLHIHTPSMVFCFASFWIFRFGACDSRLP